MAMDNKTLSFIIVGGALAVLFGYCAYLSVEVKTYPDVELATGIGFNDPGFSSSEYCNPEDSLMDVVTLPHRYPTVSGGNVTSLIHHGLSPLRQSKGMDQKWITAPPAEVMW